MDGCPAPSLRPVAVCAHGLPTDWARSHLRLPAQGQFDGAKRDRGIGECDRERHDMPVRLAEESRGVVGAAGDGIEGDVVEARDVESAGRIGDERLLRVSRGASDVYMGTRIGHDGAGVVSAPHPGLDQTRLDGPRTVARCERANSGYWQDSAVQYSRDDRDREARRRYQ